MTLNHVAIWVSDLERSREFYEKYFSAIPGSRYLNEKSGFTSYFLSFENSARLEIMTRPGIRNAETGDFRTGYAHIAFSAGSRENVSEMTELLRAGGYAVVSEPRTTGDGYFESVIKDPDGNLIELTV